MFIYIYFLSGHLCIVFVVIAPAIKIYVCVYYMFVLLHFFQFYHFHLVLFLKLQFLC